MYLSQQMALQQMSTSILGSYFLLWPFPLLYLLRKRESYFQDGKKPHQRASQDICQGVSYPKRPLVFISDTTKKEEEFFAKKIEFQVEN